MSRLLKKSISMVFFATVVLLSGCSQDSRTAEEHMAKARQYQAQGEYHASIIELKNAVKKAPRDAQARALLGRIYLAMADGAGAEKEFRRAIEYGDDALNTQLLLAEALILNGDSEAALEHLQQLGPQSGSKEQAEKEALMARANLAKGDVERAGQHLTQALRIAPDNPKYLFLRGQWLAAQEDFDAADVSVNKALSINPDYDEALLFKARLAERQGRPQEAIRAYEQVISQGPASRLTTYTSSAHGELALLALRTGDLEMARASADRLYKANSEHHIPNYLQGLIAYREENYDKAAEHLQIVHSHAPKHPPTLLTLGGAKFALGHYNQAISYLNNYLALNAGDARAEKLLGAAYMKVGDVQNALNLLESSLQRTPDDAVLLSMAGEAAINAGDIESGRRYLERAASGDQSPLNRMRLASVYIAEGQYQQAIDELESMTAESGQDEQSTVMLIRAYLQNGQTEQALDKAKAFLERNPDDASAHNLLGAVHMAAGQAGAARRQFEAALDKDKANLSARINLSRLAIANKDFDGAEKQLQQILERDEDNLLAMMIMARVAEFRGSQSQSLQWLQRASDANEKAVAPRLLLANYYAKTDDQEKALVYLDEILAAQPDNRAALAMQVDLYLSQGAARNALRAAEQLVEAAPEQPEAHVRLGRAQLANNNAVAARSSLNTALELQPGFLPAAVALARLELQAGAADKAFQLAEQVQKTQPDSAAGYSLEGDIHLAAKQYAEAAASYAKAFEREPSSVLVTKRANALRRAGEPWSVVQRPLNEWLQKHPDDVRAGTQIAMLANSMGKTDAAISAYRKVLEQQPDNAVILNDLAWLLYERSPSEEAVNMAQRAHTLEPDSGAIQDTYGWMLVQEGDVRQGLKLLESAHKAIPKHPEIAYHYAYALNQAGDHGEARALLETLLKEHEQFPSREQAEKLLSAAR